MTLPRKSNSPDAGDAAARTRFKVFGVGGAGCNAVNQLAGAIAGRADHPLAGIELVAVNTDLQALAGITSAEKLQIGSAITRGLGAGGDVELGMRAAQQDAERLEAVIEAAAGRPLREIGRIGLLTPRQVIPAAVVDYLEKLFGKRAGYMENTV